MGQGTVLPIQQLGHPALWKPAAAVLPGDIGSPRIQEVIANLRETLRAGPGVGLAAPQLGEPLRIAVIEVAADKLEETPEARRRRRRMTHVPFQVLINPTLTFEPPIHQVVQWESCLSFEGYTALVPRAARVRVRALDQHGAEVSFTTDGWHARIVQHECDHLKGVHLLSRCLLDSLSTSQNQELIWRGGDPNLARTRMCT